MSFGSSEYNYQRLFSDTSNQQNSDVFYKERRHIRAFFRKIVTPLTILVVPIILVVSFENIGMIIGQYIDTNTSYVAQRLAEFRNSFDQGVAQLGDISWLSTTLMVVWILIISWFVCKAYYDWVHAYYEISLKYVIEAQRLLLQDETSLTIETANVTGASVRRTLSDKFFPFCGSVTVQTIDFNGEGDQILLKDVKDPYRMRGVILKIKRVSTTT